MEGPRETAARAKQLVVECMEKPFDGEWHSEVDLIVDANYADTWYEAK